MSRPAAGVGGRAFALRVSALFAAIFVVAGTNLPYLPLWLDWAGLTPSEIAIITAAPLIVRIAVTPAIAFAADRAGDHRRFLIALAWGCLGALVALAFSRGFWPILACTLLFALSWTTIIPLTETIAMGGVKAAGLDYGRMRVWGSISFIAASFWGGLVVERLGAASAIWLVVAGGVVTMLAAHGLAQPISPGRGGAAAGPPRLRLADAAGLLGSRLFLIFLLTVGAVQAAHAMFYTFGTLHWRALGFSAGVCGLLWAIGVIVEVTLFACSGALLRRIGVAELLVLAAIAAVVRWTAMGFDPALWLLVPMQALHGLTFGGAHIGAIHFMGAVVPQAQAGTGQAIYASVTGGIALGGAMLVTGPLYAAYAGQGYLVMAAIGGVGLVASLVLLHAWRRTAELQPQS